MARSKIPQPLDRRHLLTRELDSAKALGIAEAYLEEGRTIEAIDFLAKADATQKLEELLEEATGQGDAFLVRAIATGLGQTLDSARWTRVAEAAEAAGKTLYAATARRQAEIED